MKKCLILLSVLFVTISMYGQIVQANYKSPLADLQSKGWKIHSHTLSYDKQTMFFSAKAPKSRNYDLYKVRANGKEWENLEALSDLNTSCDEFYPSLASDEQSLIFVKRSEEEVKGKKKTNLFYLMYTALQQSHWSAPEVIIISEGKDVSPLILADGKTVIFASSRTDDKKKDSNYALYFTRRIDERNWYNPSLILAPSNKNEHYYAPYIERCINDGAKRTITLAFTQQTCTGRDTMYAVQRMVLPEQFHPEPVLTLEGRVADVTNRRAIPADINVYHAVSFKPLAQIKTSSSGTYKVALPYGTPYFIDITGDNYSHFYCEHDCSSLSYDKNVRTDVMLDKQLSVRINAFDEDLLLPISPDEIVTNGAKITRYPSYAEALLQIGEIYDITYKKKGYADTTLHINTQNSILLTHSELDVEMCPRRTNMVLKFVDADSLSLLPTIVEMNNLDKDEDLVYHTEDSAQYVIKVRQGNAYQLYARAKGYVYKDTLLQVPHQDDPITCVIPMYALRKEMVLQLRNIHFDHNSYALTNSSYTELDKLVKLMQDNPLLRIELSAHTDDVGGDLYNMRLSQRRGEAAMKYLLRNGISSDRIVAKGYGKTKPLVPNTNDENRAINRRVEFTINAIQ